MLLTLAAPSNNQVEIISYLDMIQYAQQDHLFENVQTDSSMALRNGRNDPSQISPIRYAQLPTAGKRYDDCNLQGLKRDHKNAHGTERDGREHNRRPGRSRNANRPLN